MQVVLTKDVAHLGKKGDKKAVKNGYFRNFLAPRALAVRASDRLMQQIQKRQDHMKKKMEAVRDKAEEYKTKIEALSLEFIRKTTGKEKLYAAITDKIIQEAIEKQLNIEFEKGSVELEEPIKAVGEYNAKVKLTESVQANVKIMVKAEQ